MCTNGVLFSGSQNRFAAFLARLHVIFDQSRQVLSPKGRYRSEFLGLANAHLDVALLATDELVENAFALQLRRSYPHLRR